jgi:predicted Zn-dependent protease
VNQVETLRTLHEQQQFAHLQSACLESDTQDPSVQVLIILAALHLGDRQEAEKWLALADAQQDVMDFATRIDRAAVDILLLRIKEAEQRLLEVRKELAQEGLLEHPMLLARLGWCRMQHGDPNDARKLFEKSAQLRPDLIAVHLNLARLALNINPESEDKPDSVSAQKALDNAALILDSDKQHSWPQETVTSFTYQLHTMQLENWIVAGEDGIDIMY